MNEGISVADALALGKGTDGAFGNGAWWIIILVLLFGWGRGYGYGGNEGGYNPCCTPATAQGMTDAFNFNQLDNGIRATQNGLCDGFYAVNNTLLTTNGNTQLTLAQGFNGVNQAIAGLGYEVQSGFCGIDKSIMQANYQNQANFNSVANQLASCCCDIARGQDNIKYEMATNTNAIIAANERNADRIIEHLTKTEMEKLRTDLQSAQFQLSQNAQTNNIINQLLPVARPAYITCSPYYSSCGIGANSCNCGGCA